MGTASQHVAKVDTLRHSALQYVAQGWSVIPLKPRTKIPTVSWKVYQSNRPSPQLVAHWWGIDPEANIALVTGPISGRVVLDLDPRNDPDGATARWLIPQLPPPTTITGTGGWHWHVRESRALRTLVNLRRGLDLKAAGGFVVAPPSIHPNGQPYESLGGLLPALPAFIEPLIHAADKKRREGKGTTKPTTADDDRLRLDDVLPLLDALKLAGRGYLARCPAHADGNPSLSVGERRDGGLLLNCFAGCRYTDIIRALRDRQQIRLREWVGTLSIARD